MSLSRSLLSVAAIASFIPSSSVFAEEPGHAQTPAQEQLVSDCYANIDSYSVSGATVTFTYTVGCGSSGFRAQIWCGEGGIPGYLDRFPGYYTYTSTCTYSYPGTKPLTVKITNTGDTDIENIEVIF